MTSIFMTLTMNRKNSAQCSRAKSVFIIKPNRECKSFTHVILGELLHMESSNPGNRININISSPPPGLFHLV